MLPAHVFCPIGLRDHAGLEDPHAENCTSAAKGYRIPIMCAQATFIPGGLVLSVYAHHNVVDGGAMDKIYEIWSGHVRALPDQPGCCELCRPIKSGDPSIARRTLDASAEDLPSKSIPTCKELTTIKNNPITRPLLASPYKLSAKILRISASRIEKLRSDLQALTSLRVSSFITIAALIWMHVTRARAAALAKGNFTTTTLGIAVDTRKHSSNEVLNNCMGNMATYAGLFYQSPLCCKLRLKLLVCCQLRSQ